MKIQVLNEAEDVLPDGRGFYDRQEPGVGDYFAAALSTQQGRAPHGREAADALAD